MTNEDDEDITNALNVARYSAGADPIQQKISGLNQFLTGMDLEANVPQFHTGLPQQSRPLIGGAGLPQQPSITAYHGSPHEFEKFDLAKIGTGEGVQAYGRGLYFAESEPVAKGYRDALSEGYLINGKLADKNNIDHQAAIDIAKFGGVENAKKYHQDILDKMYDKWNAASEKEKLQNPEGKMFLDLLADIHGSSLNRIIRHEQGDVLPQAIPSGHMYEVNIKAHPDHFLDWDKPLNGQSEYVRQLVGTTPNLPMSMSGQDFHEHLANQMGALDWPSFSNLATRRQYVNSAAQKVAEHLSNQGIKGIKYLDAGSRGAGDGTRNYVVFDPSIIDVKRRYNRGGSVNPKGIRAFYIGQSAGIPHIDTLLGTQSVVSPNVDRALQLANEYDQ